MKIIIYGANEMGSIIAAEFFEDHDIIVIDPDSKSLEKFNNLDLTTICADASNMNILREADIKNCDVFIACTGIDEGNIVACLIAKQLSCAATVCFVSKKECRDSLRVIREEHRENHPLYIDNVIWPERLLTHEILRIITVPDAVDVEYFSNGRAKLLEYDCIYLLIRSIHDNLIDARPPYNVFMCPAVMDTKLNPLLKFIVKISECERQFEEEYGSFIGYDDWKVLQAESLKTKLVLLNYVCKVANAEHRDISDSPWLYDNGLYFNVDGNGGGVTPISFGEACDIISDMVEYPDLWDDDEWACLLSDAVRRWASRLQPDGTWPGLTDVEALERIEVMNRYSYLFLDGRFDAAVRRACVHYASLPAFDTLPGGSDELRCLSLCQDLLRQGNACPRDAAWADRLAARFSELSRICSPQADEAFYASACYAVHLCESLLCLSVAGGSSVADSSFLPKQESVGARW